MIECRSTKSNIHQFQRIQFLLSSFSDIGKQFQIWSIDRIQIFQIVKKSFYLMPLSLLKRNRFQVVPFWFHHYQMFLRNCLIYCKNIHLLYISICCIHATCQYQMIFVSLFVKTEDHFELLVTLNAFYWIIILGQPIHNSYRSNAFSYPKGRNREVGLFCYLPTRNLESIFKFLVQITTRINSSKVAFIPLAL